MGTLTDRPKCLAGCGRFATLDKYCFFCSPNVPEERKQEARRRGGSRPPLLASDSPDVRWESADDLKREYEHVWSQIARQEIDRNDGEVLLKGIRDAKPLVETATLARRVATLERILTRQGRRR